MPRNNRRYTRNLKISRQGRWRSLSRKRSFSRFLNADIAVFRFCVSQGRIYPAGSSSIYLLLVSLSPLFYTFFSFVLFFRLIFCPFNFFSSLSISLTLLFFFFLVTFTFIFFLSNLFSSFLVGFLTFLCFNFCFSDIFVPTI